ncbi:XRE family transcriptional regulator [Embleya sp. MST-111070]|uniref:XRE family transcriptional regulator n=1 Tax=Embleya sp. MST-111070 TaxID=3398231 RepID=UPI003F7403DD
MRSTRFRALVLDRGWNAYETFDVKFRVARDALAGREREPRLQRVTVSRRSFERWMAGDIKSLPHVHTRRVLEHMFGVRPVELFDSPPDAPTVTRDDANRPVAGPDKRRLLSKALVHCAGSPGILGGDEPSAPTRRPEVERRAFLAAGATGGLAAFGPLELSPLLTPVAPPSLPSRITPREVRQLTDLADGLHGWDNAHGGGGVLELLATHCLRWAVGLLSVDCPGHLRSDFLAAVARLGLVVGATQFDMYRHEQARSAFGLAVECAEVGDHWLLRAKAYSYLARQAIWVGDANAGLTHAERGLEYADRLPATARAMLHTARARAYGKMGRAQETFAAVGAADDAFVRGGRADDTHPLMAYYDEAQHNGDTAHALFDIVVVDGRDPVNAQERFRTAVLEHKPRFARSKTISCTKLASLLMCTGDPREAAAIGHEALEMSGTLSSRRAAADLRELAGFAVRHSKVPETRALREAITSTLQS